MIRNVAKSLQVFIVGGYRLFIRSIPKINPCPHKTSLSLGRKLLIVMKLQSLYLKLLIILQSLLNVVVLLSLVAVEGFNVVPAHILDDLLHLPQKSAGHGFGLLSYLNLCLI